MIIIRNFNERTYQISKDVDFIYNKYYRTFIRDLWNSNKSLYEVLKKDSQYVRSLKASSLDIEFGSFSSSVLQSAESEKASSLNPVTIFIAIQYSNTSHFFGNAYYPSEKKITLSLGGEIFQMVLKNSVDGSFKDTIKKILSPKYYRQAQLDFSESRMKGTINHELTHWISDSLNNQHIAKVLSRAGKVHNSNVAQGIIKQGHSNVALTDFETNAQISAIKQLYRKYHNQWKDFTLLDIISLSLPLKSIFRSLFDHKKELHQWLNYLLKRLPREHLGSPKLGNFSDKDELELERK